MQSLAQKTIIDRLQKQILDLEGYKSEAQQQQSKLDFAIIEKHFPNQVFPTGTIHEFVSGQPEHMACTSAFIFALLSKLHSNKGIYVWIGKQRQLFASSLIFFGIHPHQIIFINLVKQKDILWATEEALKCRSLSGVISELEGITFAQSQRLQLTVEKSKVTGFILRTQTDRIHATACAARWQITPIISENQENLPGVGFARWKVELLKVRNGSTASYTITYKHRKFATEQAAKTYPFTHQAIGS
ncbi:MAG: Error-prone repair protein ImuA [Pedobacter sp.]|uniref:ImuA family protein n=1 Tax=Pedobacter sp. TaxID=1411316 RepID=UPI00280992D0|nr:Error-prone repair protein ImuA [Pedobacter sp.]MDQ8003483.1 Error-prone repair protein ImuA [Pedobacter sp.]